MTQDNFPKLLKQFSAILNTLVMDDSDLAFNVMKHNYSFVSTNPCNKLHMAFY